MEKASSWLSKLKIALIISIGVAIVYSILSYLYVDNLVATGVDPLGEESQWDGFLVLIYVAQSALCSERHSG
jgi:ABC-type thiamin/hydroxymethylpyrimidine transport system permease subunit